MKGCILNSEALSPLPTLRIPSGHSCLTYTFRREGQPTLKCFPIRLTKMKRDSRKMGSPFAKSSCPGETQVFKRKKKAWKSMVIKSALLDMAQFKNHLHMKDPLAQRYLRFKKGSQRILNWKPPFPCQYLVSRRIPHSHYVQLWVLLLTVRPSR